MNDKDQLTEVKSDIIKNKTSADKALLLQLATSNNPTTLINDLMSKDIPTQLRAFTLATARSELIRVIKLTDSLDRLEDTYITRALEDQDSMDMKSLERVMNTIMNSLSRSTKLIDKVTNDTNLNLIIDQSTKIYNSTHDNSTTTVQILSDKSNREKLRNISTKLLESISKNPSDIVNATSVVREVDEDE